MRAWALYPAWRTNNKALRRPNEESPGHCLQGKSAHQWRVDMQSRVGHLVCQGPQCCVHGDPGVSSTLHTELRQLCSVEGRSSRVSGESLVTLLHLSSLCLSGLTRKAWLAELTQSPALCPSHSHRF